MLKLEVLIYYYLTFYSDLLNILLLIIVSIITLPYLSETTLIVVKPSVIMLNTEILPPISRALCSKFN